jgi:hypothetical protein
MKMWPEGLKPRPFSRRGRVLLGAALSVWLCYEAYVLFTATTDICAIETRWGCAIASLLTAVLPMSRNVLLADLYLALCLGGWAYEFLVLKPDVPGPSQNAL